METLSWADVLWFYFSLLQTMAEYASVMGVDVPKSFFPKNLFGSSIRESQGGELLLEEDGGVDDDDDDDSTSTSSDSEGETVLDTPTMLLRRQDAQKLHTETLQLQTSSPTEDLSSAPPVKAIHPTPSPQSSGREYDRLSSGTEPSPNAFGKVERSPESSAGEYERLSDSLAESPDAFESESLFQSKTYREAPATAASVQGASEAPAPTASDQPSEYSPPEAFDAATQYSAHEAPTRVASPVLQAKKPFGLSASLPVEVINLEPELPPSSSQPEPELYDVPLPSNDASSGAAGAGLPISDLITQLSFLLGVPLPSSHHLSSPHFSPSSTSALLGLVALFRTMWIDSLVWFARELSLREQQARQRQQKQKTEEKPTKRASKSKSGSAKKAAAAPPSSVQIRVCSATCTVCTQQYNLFRHEHFCRLCSSSCCDDCTSKRVSAAVLVGRMPGVHAIRGLRWDAEAQRCCHRCWLIVEAAEGKYQMKDIDMEEVD
jgi:hypothetical protein